MPLLTKRTLGDQIVELVRDRIIAGTLPAETPIRQDALAAELGVSKIPLREAFARLEQDGLVVSEANRGYFVRPLSADEAYDVFDLRLKIEPDAVAAAAARATADDHAAARLALGGLNDATAALASPDGHVGALNRAFHIALIRPAGRPLTLQMVERLQVIAERYVARHLASRGRHDRAITEHSALYEAWAAGATDHAHRLSADHIAHTLDDLRAEFRTADGPVAARFKEGSAPAQDRSRHT